MGVFDSEFDLAPAEVAARMERDEMLLVDVREDYEWEAGRVPGSQHIEMERIAEAAGSLPADRPVAFLCLAGMRSGMVARAFRAAGYEAYNVNGGFRAWVMEGLPTEPDDASIAPH